MMHYYLLIYSVTIFTMFVFHLFLMRRVNNKLKHIEVFRKETDHKLDVLIKIAHTHEQFIDSVKKKSEEILIRNRQRGAR